jgi:hypothetical protein
MEYNDLKKDLDQPLLNSIEDATFNPVFILGLNRSGTTILYKMLTETNCLTPVTIYHLICYNQLLYNHVNNLETKAKNEINVSIKTLGLNHRAMDRIQLSAEFTEEYGFIFGEKSFWKKLNQKNIPKFNELCKKIKFISENDDPILLKNPLDFPNFLFIKKAYPNAKFIFIHRNPINVLSSTMKTVKVLFETKKQAPDSVYKYYNKVFENPLLLKIVKIAISDYFPFVTLFLINYTKKTLRHYIKNIESLPKSDYVVVKYEDLCDNPQENMEQIIKFLNIKLEKNIDFKSYIAPRKTTLDKSVKKLQKYIYKNMEKYFDLFGYTTR